MKDIDIEKLSTEEVQKLLKYGNLRKSIKLKMLQPYFAKLLNRFLDNLIKFNSLTRLFLKFSYFCDSYYLIGIFLYIHKNFCISHCPKWNVKTSNFLSMLEVLSMTSVIVAAGSNEDEFAIQKGMAASNFPKAFVVNSLTR